MADVKLAWKTHREYLMHTTSLPVEAMGQDYTLGWVTEYKPWPITDPMPLPDILHKYDINWGLLWPPTMLWHYPTPRDADPEPHDRTTQVDISGAFPDMFGGPSDDGKPMDGYITVGPFYIADPGEPVGEDYAASGDANERSGD